MQSPVNPVVTTPPALARAATAGRGPHLLEAGLEGARSAGLEPPGSARRDALLDIGWRHSRVALGAPGRSPRSRAPWFSAARWWLDRASVARLIAEASPDVIETADPFVLGGAVLEAADRLGVPAVALCNDDPLLGLGSAQGVDVGRVGLTGWAENRALGLLQRVYEGYDLVLAPSRWMAARLQAHGVRHAAYEPAGVDCSIYTPDACDHVWRRQFETSLHITPGTRLLVYVGRFSAAMRLDLLVRAVQNLGPGHALLAVGDGPCPPCGDRVICLPAQQDDAHQARLLASCDAFVHAGGEAEHSGTAALDAMACGLPVVVSRAGVLGEMAEGAGTTLDSACATEWAEALRATLVSPSWPMFWAALERARSHDWAVVVHRQALRYRQVLGSARSSSEGQALDRLDRAQAI